MMTKAEAEVDKIRLKLYEETKNMTVEEHTRWSNEHGQRLAAQYGFRIVNADDQTKRGRADVRI